MTAAVVNRLGVLVLGVAVLHAGFVIAAEPAAIASAPATARRSEGDVWKEIAKFSKENAPLPAFDALCSAEGRAKDAERLREPLVKLAQLNQEISAFEPKVAMTPPGGTKVYFQGRAIMYLAMAGSLGSADAQKQLEALAASTNKEWAASGKTGQLLQAWLLANSDAAARGKVLDGFVALAKENPKSEAIASGLLVIKQIRGLPAEELARVDAIFADTLTGDVASIIQAAMDAGSKQKAAVGKRLVLEGKTIDGKNFSTKEYAGKVILIDFWATWCAPCMFELPHVKELYEKYHDKGFEVVGVSCDGNAEAITKFTAEKNYPWVQLWDKDRQGGDKGQAWHPLATEWKINGIPQMFLIDRQGVLRTVEARKVLDELIPKLLEEKAEAGK